MRRFKIFITIFILYEFVMLTILQIPSFCINTFNLSFCEYGAFKYFLMCIMLPILFSIFVWWAPDIAKLFCSKSCEVAPPQPKETLRDILQEIISKQDIERLITTAIIMGVQKFAQKHPKTQTVFGNILDVLTKSDNKKRK